MADRASFARTARTLGLAWIALIELMLVLSLTLRRELGIRSAPQLKEESL